jgi:hypothetical protein
LHVPCFGYCSVPKLLKHLFERYIGLEVLNHRKLVGRK